MNLCEIGLFHIVWVFLKVLVIIIMRFGENNVFGPKYIDIYQFLELVGGGCYMVTLHFCLLFIKTEKVQEQPILNQILHHFDLTKNFLG